MALAVAQEVQAVQAVEVKVIYLHIPPEILLVQLTQVEAAEVATFIHPAHRAAQAL